MSYFSLFSRPHPLVPPCSTFHLPHFEGITDVAEGFDDLHWGQSGIPNHLAALNCNHIELPQSELLQQELCDAVSISSSDVCSQLVLANDGILAASGTQDYSCFQAFGSSMHSKSQDDFFGFAPGIGGVAGGSSDLAQVVGPAGSIKQLLGLPFMDPQDRLSLAVHRVGRTLLIDSAPPQYAGACSSPAASSSEDEDENSRSAAPFSAGEGQPEVGRGAKDRRRRRRASQRAKKKLSAMEKALCRRV